MVTERHTCGWRSAGAHSGAHAGVYAGPWAPAGHTDARQVPWGCGTMRAGRGSQAPGPMCTLNFALHSEHTEAGCGHRAPHGRGFALGAGIQMHGVPHTAAAEGDPDTSRDSGPPPRRVPGPGRRWPRLLRRAACRAISGPSPFLGSLGRGYRHELTRAAGVWRIRQEAPRGKRNKNLLTVD